MHDELLQLYLLFLFGAWIVCCVLRERLLVSVEDAVLWLVWWVLEELWWWDLCESSSLSLDDTFLARLWSLSRRLMRWCSRFRCSSRCSLTDVSVSSLDLRSTSSFSVFIVTLFCSAICKIATRERTSQLIFQESVTPAYFHDFSWLDTTYLVTKYCIQKA